MGFGDRKTPSGQSLFPSALQLQTPRTSKNCLNFGEFHHELFCGKTPCDGNLGFRGVAAQSIRVLFRIISVLQRCIKLKCCVDRLNPHLEVGINANVTMCEFSRLAIRYAPGLPSVMP